MITSVISFGSTTFGTNYDVAFFAGSQPRLPAAQIETLELVGAYPVITALTQKQNRLALLITINDIANVDSLRSALFRAFDSKDTTPKVLVVNSTGGVPQYVYAQCEEFVPYSTPRHQQAYAATLVVHGDAKWRAVTADAPTAWNITVSGQSTTLTNNGEDDAYPVYNLKPTAAKTGGYLYKRWVPITWPAHNPGLQYPCVAIFDTATPIGASKMQADGDDLRVISDGVEIYRWLDSVSWNSASSKVWFNLDFQPAQIGTLKTAISASGAITVIELNEDIASWPSSGIVLIASEAFVFTNKDTSRKLLSGITRAAKGTAEASHAIGASVAWIQHDVWIVYGNSTVSAPTVDDQYKPAFELDHSNNGSWVYENFGEMGYLDWGDTGMFTGEHRAGRWNHFGNLVIAGGTGGVYTATQRGWANIYSVAGAWISTQCGISFGWRLNNPCGITNVVWTNGLKRRATANFYCDLGYWERGKTWWSYMYYIPSPSVLNAWESWSYSGPAFNVSDTIEIALGAYPSDVEVGDVTVTLNAAGIPTVTVNAEQATYTFAATLTNSTTGESLSISFECDLNNTLQIDTYNKVVTYLKDNSAQFNAITLPVRAQWLRLQPGANTIVYTDIGTNAVTLTTTWNKRYY